MKSTERVGLELELLAPPDKSREDLARALARQAGGALRRGWKYHGHGLLEDGRPDCHLTPAWHVDALGTSFVDDPTIVDDLTPGAPPLRIARTDDVRLAAFIERTCDVDFRALVKTFGAVAADDGFVDPWGQPLVRWHAVSSQRLRVTEVVLPPLAPRTLATTLRHVMKTARDLGFLVPKEAAVHAHFDAAPFRSTAALRRLVLAWTAQRDAWRARFEPNPHCRKLGPFPEHVVRVAKEATDDMDFETVAAGMLLGGLHRAVDVNLLGLVEKFPKQPTIEVRCLPGSLDADATLARLEHARAFLASLR